MKWFLIYMVLSSPGEWEVPEGFGPSAHPNQQACETSGMYWVNAHGVAENETLACIEAPGSDAAIAKFREILRSIESGMFVN